MSSMVRPHSRPSRPGPYRGKRPFDLAVLALVAIPAAVVGAVCAIAIAVTSRGPVLFRQERVGMGGRTFLLLKLRTMRHDERGNPLHPDPERITPVGAVLRRLSLDELPQLVNVARGEMSIVGPRPTLAYQVARYDERQRGRLGVPPGLTGLAAVAGRNALSWEERIELDLEYVRRQSLALDVSILARTLGAVVAGRGVEGHRRDDRISGDGTEPV